MKVLAPAVLGCIDIGELFEAFEMKNARVEVGREFGGLLRSEAGSESE